MQHSLRFAVSLSLLVLLSGILLPAHPAAAASFTVTSTSPTGAGSLSEAITNANNSPVDDLITFNLPGQPNAGGYWTIQVATGDVISSLTGGGTTIDGTSQPGGRADGGPKIELSGPGGSIGASGLTITSANNVIKGLIVNRFPGGGIRIDGAAATGNQLYGNYIGTSGDGNSQAGNSDSGVWITNGAANNIVGGTGAGQRNVISGNSITSGRAQVVIETEAGNSQETRGNQIVGNYIGTNANGTGALPNFGGGVLLGKNATANTIGPSNVISGNSPATSQIPVYGVSINGTYTIPVSQVRNVIKGNIIGLNANGTAALPNGSSNSGGGGVRVQVGGNNLIGGPNAGDGNVISGHNINTTNYGILLDAPCDASLTTATEVQGNIIGLNPAGNAAIPNSQGVRVVANSADPVATQVGPCNQVIGPGNTISGNATDGMRIIGVPDAPDTRQTRGIVIKGNRIGTNVAGTGAVPNGNYGIWVVDGTINNTIGGPAASDGNTISGNTNYGIVVETFSGRTPLNESNSPNNILIQRNLIGTTVDGNNALPNGTGGVALQRVAHDNTLDSNVISGHNGATSVGVLIQDINTTNNRLIGNKIGTNAAGTGGIPNRLGINVVGGTTNNSIGEAGQGQNLISFNATYGVALNNTNGNRVVNNDVRSNGNDGVLVNGGNANRISATQTGSNGGNGIALSNNGNNNRQAPGNLSLNGNTLIGNAPGCSGCTIELFTNDVAPPAEVGEGNTYLATPSPVTTDGAGNFSIALPVTGCKPYLVVTVTDAANNTSPFSQPIGPVAVCTAPVANITLSADNSPSRFANPGDVVTYSHVLQNTGNVQTTVTVGVSSSQGWATLVPPDTTYTLNPNETRTITVRVVVPANAQAGTVDLSTITASIPGKSVQQTDTTTVNQSFGFLFEPPTRNGSALPGQTIEYTHYITNTGNGPDTFTLSASNTAAAQGVTVSFPNCTPSCTIAAGGSLAVIVRVTVAADSPATVDIATITATSQGGGTKSVVDTTQIQQVPVPQFEPDALQGFGKPGTTVTYTHTLRNIGGAAGTFDVNATLPANAVADGWTVTVAPVGTFNLAPGATRPVTVVVSIPPYTPARTTTYSGTQILATVTATAGAGNPTAAANDTTTVLLQPALQFQPDRASSGAPNQVLNYTHTITNTGNGTERFNFTVAPPAGWSAIVRDATSQQQLDNVVLARGEARNVIVQVTIPAGNPVNGTTIVTATAASDPTVRASVRDTTTIVQASVPKLSPGQTGATDPGVPISFTHTITNVGNLAATTNPFSITVNVPAGWAAATITPASIPLDIGAQTTFIVTVTPPANAPVGSYPITVRATATDSNRATDAVIDTITVNARARLQFTPNYNDLRDPGTVVTYTHTLTNSGNFTDTIGIVASASQPWAVRVVPAQTTLAPNASTLVTVTLTIPPGIVAGLQNTTLVTATSSQPSVRAVVTDTTTIRAVPGLLLTPPLIELAGEAGEPVTFTYTLLNTGSVPQSATLTATPPAGWTATPLPTTVPTIQPGQQVNVQVVVTAPEGTARNTVADTLLRATSSVNSPDTGTPPSTTATARLRVGPAFQFVIEPDRAQGARPGEVIRYSHLLTNTGLLTDTIVLSVQSLLGWEVSVAPSSVTVGPGATVPVTVTVSVPTSAEAGFVEQTTVTGRSTSRQDVQDSATDTTTVLRVAGVNISPRQSAVGTPRQVIEFQHRVFNIGNSPDAFTFSYTAPAGWQVTLIQTRTIELLPGFSTPVQVRVSMPDNVGTNIRGNITIRATSIFNPAVYDEVVDTLSTGRIQNPDQPQETPYRVYLVRVQKLPE